MRYLILFLAPALILSCSDGNGPNKAAPVISSIPDQTIEINEDFDPINLDDYVSDADHADDQLTWSYSGNTELSIDITDRIATISPPSSEWTGEETLIFRATDPDMLMDEDTAVFTVNDSGPVPAGPIISAIPDQSIAKNMDFDQINLDDYVSDANNSDDELTWGYSGNSDLNIDITDRIATISKPSSSWVGSETVIFQVTDPTMNSDEDTVVFSVVDSLAFNAIYFPVADGDTWYYTSQTLGQVVRTVDGDTTINGRACIRVLEGGVTAEAWSVEESGAAPGFYVHLLSLGSVFYEFDPPLRIPFDMQQDETYNYEATVTKYVSGSVDEIFDISGHLRFEGFVNYNVPAGDFENVIQIYYIEDNYSEYYAPGVGLLDNEDYVLDSAYIGGIWYR